MFTGIVAAQGRLQEVEAIGRDQRLTVVDDGDYLADIAEGDSIAVNGVCLTAQQLVAGGFVADVSVETLEVTTAAGWQAGTPVNLERATTPATALGGHLVLGHVDGLATLRELHEDARSWRLGFEAPAALARYIARKGSVTLDGVSLTVNEIDNGHFGVNIIPVTWSHTSLGRLQVGGQVNLEVDVVARYVERLMSAQSGES